MSNPIKQTVHKGSKSIDFISHNLRAAISKPSVSHEDFIDVPERRWKERIQSKDVYCHSFYRPNGIDALIKTIKHKRSNKTGGFQVFTILTDSEPRFEKDAGFDSERQVIALLNKIPKHYETMAIVEYPEPELNLSGKAKSQLSKTYDGTSQSLDNILNLAVTNEKGHQVTIREKIFYIIGNKLDTTKLPELEEFTSFLSNYLIRTESPTENKIIITTFLNQFSSQKHQPDTYEQLLDILSNFETQLLSKFTYLKKDPKVLNSLAKAYIHLDDYENTKKFIDRCISTEVAPDYDTLKSYIELTQKKYESKEIEKFNYFASLVGLDNAIHTHLDGELANELLKRAQSPEEIITVIKTLKDKFEGDALKDEVLKIKPFIQKYLKLKHISSQVSENRDPAIRITVYQEFKKVTGDALDEDVLLSLRSHRNFTFAHKTLQKYDRLDKDLGLTVLNDATSVPIQVRRPGFDEKAQTEFIKLLRTKFETK